MQLERRVGKEQIVTRNLFVHQMAPSWPMNIMAKLAWNSNSNAWSCTLVRNSSRLFSLFLFLSTKPFWLYSLPGPYPTSSSFPSWSVSRSLFLYFRFSCSSFGSSPQKPCFKVVKDIRPSIIPGNRNSRIVFDRPYMCNSLRYTMIDAQHAAWYLLDYFCASLCWQHDFFLVYCKISTALRNKYRQYYKRWTKTYVKKSYHIFLLKFICRA